MLSKVQALEAALSAGTDQRVVVFYDDPTTHKLEVLRTLEAAHPTAITCCAVNEPLSLIATASGGDIRLWNLHSLSFEGGVIGHQACTARCIICMLHVNVLQCSTRVYTAAVLSPVLLAYTLLLMLFANLWRVAAHTLQLQQAEVLQLLFLPGAPLLLSTDVSGECYVWSIDFSSSSSSSTNASSTGSTSVNGNLSNGSANGSSNGLVPGCIDTSAPALDPWIALAYRLKPLANKRIIMCQRVNMLSCYELVYITDAGVRAAESFKQHAAY
eukprot:14228-Heterococcus_DN1.PRE.2